MFIVLLFLREGSWNKQLSHVDMGVLGSAEFLVSHLMYGVILLSGALVRCPTHSLMPTPSKPFILSPSLPTSPTKHLLLRSSESQPEVKPSLMPCIPDPLHHPGFGGVPPIQAKAD